MLLLSRDCESRPGDAAFFAVPGLVGCVTEMVGELRDLTSTRGASSFGVYGPFCVLLSGLGGVWPFDSVVLAT